MKLKRWFGKLREESGEIKLSETIDTCVDLHWFLERYPMHLSAEDSQRLNGFVSSHHEEIARLDDLIDGNYQPRQFQMAIEARPYQKVAAEVFLAKRGLLLADALGLGKTVTAITSLTDPQTLPAVVVCPPHLRRQWRMELEKFAPQLTCHTIKSSRPYELPRIDGRGPDVLVISYAMLSDWQAALAKYCSSVIYDEAHELRRKESNKYAAAKHVSGSVDYRLGLSGTPISNYGGEIFNVMECIHPDVFGTWSEFLREWCPGATADRPIVKYPQALGAWMKSQHLMIRRTMDDVGQQLPDVIRVTHAIDSDDSELRKVDSEAGKLARIILSENAKLTSKAIQMNAMGQMVTLLRQATGISKAPYVAAFVEMLIESGESVLLAGWHRQVYRIWLEKLGKYRPAMYTGSETDSQKQREKEKFVKGETPLMIISLRSGIGLDGLQHRSNTVVLGELDWTPAAIEQLIGRLHRDGQKNKVTAYFLISNSGLDPEMAEVLGVKKGQVDGIRDDIQVMQRGIDSGAAIRRVAQKYLDGKL